MRTGEIDRPVPIEIGASALMIGFVAATWATTAQAATYPERAITIIVPFQPAGASDSLGRVLTKPLSEALGKTVVIENRPGAGGNIGIGLAARAKPDGYTLLLTSSVVVVNPSLYKQAGFDPIKDFAPISDCGASPNVIATRADSGINSITEMIALARSKPDLLNYSSGGIGVTPHLGMELFKSRAGINVTHVPYPGGGPAILAILSAATQVGSVNILGLMQHVNAGTIRVLVQTGRERWSELPNVPTMAEAGFPNTESETFVAMLAPAGTPQEIVDRLAKETNAILKRPESRDILKQMGFGVIAGEPAALRARIAREVPMWKDVIEKANVRVE
jgi:tripartite-type tricarboxylate transporter receptor subunit TctC